LVIIHKQVHNVIHEQARDIQQQGIL